MTRYAIVKDGKNYNIVSQRGELVGKAKTIDAAKSKAIKAIDKDFDKYVRADYNKWLNR